mmetsp:Transcript_13480/g.34592  ORF Transcript_13480/g.34592 Transcript_13480/m.34592 type:complete len:207 (+) Transcript_13480:449-1069(+)
MVTVGTEDVNPRTRRCYFTQCPLSGLPKPYRVVVRVAVVCVVKKSVPKALPLVNLVLEEKRRCLKERRGVLSEVAPPGSVLAVMVGAARVNKTLAQHGHCLDLLCEGLTTTEPAVPSGLRPAADSTHGGISPCCAKALVAIGQRAHCAGGHVEEVPRIRHGNIFGLWSHCLDQLVHVICIVNSGHTAGRATGKHYLVGRAQIVVCR